jgi:hypothetical protein
MDRQARNRTIIVQPRPDCVMANISAIRKCSTTAEGRHVCASPVVFPLQRKSVTQRS